jgi:hypothetical protein
MQTRRGGGGWERVARRPRAETLLEHILHPGNLFQAESGEADELRTAPACMISAMDTSSEKKRAGEVLR